MASETWILQVLFGIGEKVQELKGNVDQAAKTKDDAAERVTPESPGSSQESNAEKVRQQAGECPVECLLEALPAQCTHMVLLYVDEGGDLPTASRGASHTAKVQILRPARLALPQRTVPRAVATPAHQRTELLRQRRLPGWLLHVTVCVANTYRKWRTRYMQMTCCGVEPVPPASRAASSSQGYHERALTIVCVSRQQLALQKFWGLCADYAT